MNRIAPRFTTPVYTATRVLFNEGLRHRTFSADATIGIDADGYTVAGRRDAPPHVACIKGVLGDAVPFEKGPTRASLAFHAWLEARHAKRADLVITPSAYCAQKVEELYQVKNAVVVPELIDLASWRDLFLNNPARPDPERFTILTVCRFYPRKRLDVLLAAAGIARHEVPNLEIRIVGNGPESDRLQQISHEQGLNQVVQWLGDLAQPQLAAEYNRCDAFCLPSSQEGFGIVFLEAMAAGKPIVAAKAAAVPEVVKRGILVDPDNPESLAQGLVTLANNSTLRATLGAAGRQDVETYSSEKVVQQFLTAIAKVVPTIRVDSCPFVA